MKLHTFVRKFLKITDLSAEHRFSWVSVWKCSKCSNNIMSHLSSLDSQSHIVVYCPKGATSVPAFAPSLCRIETFRFLLRKEPVSFPVLLCSSQYHETENNKTPTLYLIAGGYFNVSNYPNIDFFDLKLLSPINCQLPSCPDLRKTLTSH